MIYGLFSPSWAAKLRYNLRTFPHRVSSRISGQNFVDYDSYKLSSADNVSIDLPEIEPIIDLRSESEIPTGNMQNNSDATSTDKTIQSFSWLVPQFVEIETSVVDPDSDKSIDTWYSKSDLLWIINSYIETHLDDDTDILVTVEHNGDKSDPEKIILQPYPKNNNQHWSAITSFILRKLTNKLLHWKKSETPKNMNPLSVDDSSPDLSIHNEDEKDVIIEEPIPQIANLENLEPEKQATPTASNINSAIKSHNTISQKEQQEAEELFSILF